MNYAVKIEGRPWQEDVELPWTSIDDLQKSVYTPVPEEGCDISAVCDYFRRTLYGVRHAQCEIDDVEARVHSSGLLELEFTYQMFYDRETHRRRMWVTRVS